MDHIRLIITDDDPLVRMALRHFVSRDSQIEVVAEAASGTEALDLVEQHRPDVVMMDIQMPGMNGIETTEVITSRWPGTCVVAVTTLATPDAVIPMLSAGASGYMLKDSSPEELIAALRQSYAGTSSLSPRIAGMLVRHVRDAKTGHSRAPGELMPLTEREDETLHNLALGMSNAEIADAMHVSEATAKAHLGSIMQKWNVRDRVQVLVAAARAGIVKFD